MPKGDEMPELKVVQQTIIGLNQEALEEWKEYRQEKKKPLSQLALNKVVKFLLKYPEDHQQTIVDAAIMNDWQGLHEVEHEKAKRDDSTDPDAPGISGAERTRRARERQRQRERARQ